MGLSRYARERERVDGGLVRGVPDRLVTDPTGPVSGSDRVHRGGSWSVSQAALRSAKRPHGPANWRGGVLGFRVGFKQVGTPNTAPAFADGSTFTTAENNASASFVVTATDPDANTTLVYAKSGPDAGKFDLNASTGTLTFTNTPDYEANASAAGNNAFP